MQSLETLNTMNSEFFYYSGFMILGVFISSLSQILLKQSANERHKTFLKEYLNVKVTVAYGMFLLATLLSIYAFRVIPLSLGSILDAFGYVFITIIGAIVFKERVMFKRILALLLIISGTVVYFSELPL